MKTQVSIHHNDYPSGMRNLVREKLEQISRYCRGTTKMEVHLERQADRHRVEIIADVPHGPVLVADARAAGLRGALDGALTRMARKLKQSREKQTTARRRGGRGAEA